MSFELKVSTYGDAPNMRGMIEGLAEISRDMSQALPLIAATFHRQMSRRFDEQGAGGPSGPWAPLSPAYALRKARLYPGRGILEASGMLRASLEGAGPDAIVEYRENGVFLGSSIPYAVFHATGTTNMPKRPPIDPSSEDVREWTVEVWRWYMTESVKKGWKGRFAGAMA